MKNPEKDIGPRVYKEWGGAYWSDFDDDSQKSRKNLAQGGPATDY